jgi:hypothetical protein
MSSADLSKDYHIIAYWHTNIGRNFIAQADIDEQMLRTKGVDFSNAELGVSRTARYDTCYLKGVSSIALRQANMTAHFKAVDQNGNTLAEADSTLRLSSSQIPSSGYTVLCQVKDQDTAEVIWQAEKHVDGKESSTNNNTGSSRGNSNTSGSSDSYVERFANEPELVCTLRDPFEKRVQCVIDRMYHLGFFRARGYTYTYCISSGNEQVCGKRKAEFLFQDGGDKQFTMQFTYSKEGQQPQTVTKSTTVHIPSSLEEILSDPEKGLVLEVQIVDPVLNKVKVMAYFKDRYFSSAFAKRYAFQLALYDSDGNTLYQPPFGRYFFYYQIPPSLEQHYRAVAQVLPKGQSNAQSLYTVQSSFTLETLRDNMAELLVEQPEHRKGDPWGAYRFEVKVNPPQITRYLGWTVTVTDSDGNEVMSYERLSRKTIRVPAPGTYTFRMRVYPRKDPDTTLIEKSRTISATNQKPEVQITDLQTLVDYRGRHVLVVQLSYSDPDGRIKKVEVNACDYSKPKHYQRNTFDCGDRTSTSLSIRVCDDAEECTELNQTVRW